MPQVEPAMPPEQPQQSHANRQFARLVGVVVEEGPSGGWAPIVVAGSETRLLLCCECAHDDNDNDEEGWNHVHLKQILW